MVEVEEVLTVAPAAVFMAGAEAVSTRAVEVSGEALVAGILPRRQQGRDFHALRQAHRCAQVEDSIGLPRVMFPGPLVAR